MAESKEAAGTSAEYYQAHQLGQLGQPAQHYENVARFQHPPPGADMYHQTEQPRQITRMIYSAQLEEITQDISYLITLTNRLKNKMKNI